MRNLIRLTAVASRQAAFSDLMFIYDQLKDRNPPVDYRKDYGHRRIDQATRKMINWAKTNNIEIQLPTGWKDVQR
jgi:hypothetical protein